MSQHDFDIANQTALNARADINLALKALASNSSGSVAPTTTYANMTYYNTATNILYKRNEADSAWITLGTIDETAGTFTPSGERALASQAEAQVGVNNTVLMTPLRTFEAIGQANSAPVKTALNAGGSAPIYGCRAWVSFNGQSVSINASGNVGSVSSAGYFQVNFTTAMPDANYAVTATAQRDAGGTDCYTHVTTLTVNGFRVYVRDQYANLITNPLGVYCAVFR